MEFLRTANYWVRYCTQRITMILVWTLFIGGLIVMGWAVNVVGLREFIDGFYEISLTLFWGAMIASRLFLAVTWYFSVDRLVRQLYDWGYFWFKSSMEPYPKEFSVDKSNEIIGIVCMVIVVIVVSFFICEIAIRVTQALLWGPENILFYLPKPSPE